MTKERTEEKPTFIVDLNAVGRLGADEGDIPTLREHATCFPLLPIVNVGDPALALCEEDFIVECIVSRVNGRQISLRPDWDRQYPAVIDYAAGCAATASGPFISAPVFNGEPMRRVTR